MKRDDGEKRDYAMAWRLRVIRRAVGLRMGRPDLTQTDFVELTHIGLSAWNNCEKGQPLGSGTARVLIARWDGLSFGYIYEGKKGDLNGTMLALVEQAERMAIEEGDLPAQPAPKRRRGGKKLH